MVELGLFAEPERTVVEPPPEATPGERLRARQAANIRLGLHPLEDLAPVVDLPVRDQLVELAPDRSSLLAQMLCIDGVTDLAVYRMLTGRSHFEEDWEPPPRPDPADVPAADGQLALFLLMPGGGR